MKSIKKFFLAFVLFLGVNHVVAAPMAYTINTYDGRQNAELYIVDLATGASTMIGSLGVRGDFEALAVDPTTGILYTASDGNSLYTVNPTTGSATLVGRLGVSYTNGGMAFDNRGQGYLITSSGLFSFNKTTGQATSIGDSETNLSGGAFIGETLFATPDNGSSTNNQLVTVNTLNGSVSNVGSLGFIPRNQTGLSSHPSIRGLYMLDEGTKSFYLVNPLTGFATSLSSFPTGVTFEGLAIGDIRVVTQPDINVTDSVMPEDDRKVPFGTVSNVGENGNEETVTVTNNGDDDLLMGDVYFAREEPQNFLAMEEPQIFLAIEEPENFIITSDNCTEATLAPGESCTITVQFVPENPCLSTAILRINSNDPDEPVVDVTLEGVVTDNNGGLNASDLLFSSSTLKLYAISTTYNTSLLHNDPITVNILNQGESATAISKIGLYNDDVEYFSLDVNPEVDPCASLPRILGTTESCNVSIDLSTEMYGTIHKTTLGVFSDDGTCSFHNIQGTQTLPFFSPYSY